MINKHWLLCVILIPTLLPAQTPSSEDGVHTNAEGQFTRGKVAATAVEEF
ncbi:MAG: hypothetical protein GY903_23850 [Fuerstiella sp.]|nr:hypothetical protein [Fuerstiella sp.]MCP4857528.1 hypothetical protein [Fuerstiella sp.]